MEKKATTYSWDFVDPPSSDCFCPTCGDILQEPMLTNCCGKHFCKSCIEPLFQTKQPCPNKKCLETDYLCIVDKPKWKKIMELDVICPLKGRGCNWKGEVGTRDKHLDPQEGNCEYIDVECTNGCGEEMELYELAEHLERFCHKRPYTCEHCGFENVFEVVTKDHVHECPAFPIECPCDSDNITRSSYPEHLLACPEQVVECEFSYAGCLKRVLRKNMAQHQQDDVYTHLSLQTAFASKQLTEKDKQLNDFYHSWEERFCEVKLKMEQLTVQHEQQEVRLSKKIDKLKGLICKLGLSLTFSQGRKLILKQANIANECVHVIVNAAASDLSFDYGVARALNEASKGNLEKQFRMKATPSPYVGSVVVSQGGGNLQCKSVINAFGPGSYTRINDDSGNETIIAHLIAKILTTAEQKDACSIAIPAIGGGNLRRHIHLVARTIFDTIYHHKFTKPPPILSDIRIVVIDSATYETFATHFMLKLMSDA